jgi:hypothetical protein
VGTTRLLAAGILTAAAGTVCGCPGGDDVARPERSPEAQSPVVELYPIPAAVAELCRSVQERSRTTVLCPRRLPRPRRDLAGSSALAPPVLTAFAWGARGVDFSYSGETGRPARDHPDRFFHFQAIEQDLPLPAGTRPAVLGGKPGLLAPASSREYASETYFANHWRFFWSEQGAEYAATLHHFGRRTRRLSLSESLGLGR